MSTTSCPRCSAQVTLPVGVSNDATVRCPLCHAHYTLADALVNMPPLLEVVEDGGESLAARWLDDGDAAEDVPTAVALPAEDPSEADTLELGGLDLDSLVFDDAPAETPLPGEETLAEDQGFPTIESPLELEASEPQPLADLSDDDALQDLQTEDFTAESVDVEEELLLDFGGSELSAEDAGAETIELGSEPLATFKGANPDDLAFDLESADDSDPGATIDFSAPPRELDKIGEPLDQIEEQPEDVLAFDDASDSEAETVHFESHEAGLGGDEDLMFQDPLAAKMSTGEELREFEDLRVDPTGEATDIPEMAAVASGIAAESIETEEAPKGKKGKKEKKKKEKKAKQPARGDRPKRSLVGILVGALIAIPAALYGALWLGRDYDLVGLSDYLPAAVLPAEYSKKSVAQNYIPPAATNPLPETGDVAPTTADEMTSEEPIESSADGAVDESTAHTTARPANDAPAADSDGMPADVTEDEAPSLAEPTDAASPAEMPAEAPATTSAAEDDLFAPAAEMASSPASDPFAPAADSPTASDPFAPATDTPADSEPAEDIFAPAEEMPAEEAPAPAADDDLFAPAEQPAEASSDDLFAPAPAKASADAAADDLFAPDTEEMPAGAPADDPFGPTNADSSAEEPVESDLFGPAEQPATPAEITRPASPDPFAPEPATPADEMPAFDDSADPLTDQPAEEDIFAPEPAAVPDDMPAEDPAEHDPLLLPAEPAAPQLLSPTDVPAPAVTPSEAVGPRNFVPVSQAELNGAMQATFLAGQQLLAAEAGADESQLRKARATFYVNLFGMANAITAAQRGAGAAELEAQLEQLTAVVRQQLTADPRRLEALKVFGARWIGFPKRTTDGVVVSGTVESARQVGQLFHTKTRLGSGAEATSITIVSERDPQLASGDTVIALGSIVDRPTEQIAGYEGNEHPVVWSDMAMKVPGE